MNGKKAVGSMIHDILFAQCLASQRGIEMS